MGGKWSFGVSIYNNTEQNQKVEIIFQKDQVKQDPIMIEVEPRQDFLFMNNLYVTDPGAYQVYFITPTGVYLTVYQFEKGASSNIQKIYEVINP